MTRYRFIMFLSTATILLFTAAFTPGDKFQNEERVSYNVSPLFTPNTAGGWVILSYSLNQQLPDSVTFDFIPGHDNNISWTTEQWIGTISDSNYIPATEQFLTYYLLPGNSWNVHITTDGKCYFNLISGFLPPGDPIIIPVRVMYKNN